VSGYHLLCGSGCVGKEFECGGLVSMVNVGNEVGGVLSEFTETTNILPCSAGMLTFSSLVSWLIGLLAGDVGTLTVS
jgi:hypothetical protein